MRVTVAALALLAASATSAAGAAPAVSPKCSAALARTDCGARKASGGAAACDACIGAKRNQAALLAAGCTAAGAEGWCSKGARLVYLCPNNTLSYCDPTRPLQARIDDILGRMTLHDKMMTMGTQSIQGKNPDNTSIVARKVSWWNEALHGLRNGCDEASGACATQFPEANALGCSFNKTLFFKMADAISTEMRAYYNMGAVGGMTAFAPQLNMAANPLWGRNMECPGEDPHLTSVYAEQYTKGFQGYGHPSGLLKAIVTPKHFTGQLFEGDGSQPWSNGTTVNRQDNDTRYPLHDLEAYYLPAFRAAMVDGEAGSVMCAYQSVNGVPMCANGFILNTVVRQSWNWTGFVISDCDAINTMQEAKCEFQVDKCAGGRFGHGYSLGGPESVRDGIRGGCDTNCGSPYSASGMDALTLGLVDEAMLDVSVGRMLRAQLKMGMFDPVDGQPWAHLNWSDVGTPEHKQLALEAARQSIVLLQRGKKAAAGGAAGGGGGGPILPLKKGGKIFVTGPHYNATASLLGNYRGAVCASPPGGGDSHPEPCMVSLAQWVEKLNDGGSVRAMPGLWDCNNHHTVNFTATVAAAKQADTIVFAAGLPSGSDDGPGGQGGRGAGGGGNEGEGTDRWFLHLPGAQQELFDALRGTGKPVVVILINGGTVSIDAIKASDAAVVEAFYPGQAGAQALSEILFGETNPSGKLTATIYPEDYARGEPVGGMPWMDSQVRPHEGINQTATQGRTHMWYTGTPLYPFGHGLSYTEFSMQFGDRGGAAAGGGGGGSPPVPTISLGDVQATGFTTVPAYSIVVTNRGGVAGKETVLAFWSPPDSVDPLLKQQLFAFESTILQPGASETITIALPTDASKIATVTENGDRIFAAGEYTVKFSRGHGEPLVTTVVVTPDAPLVSGGGGGGGGATQVLLKAFPKRFVEGHELTVDACVEGSSDVVPHTEDFLVGFKQFSWVPSTSHIQHRPSGMCLTAVLESDGGSGSGSGSGVRMFTCGKGPAGSVQKWDSTEATSSFCVTAPKVSPGGSRRCLWTGANTTRDVRVPVSVKHSQPPQGQQGWSFDAQTGLVKSAVSGLCLAARQEGIYNRGS